MQRRFHLQVLCGFLCLATLSGCSSISYYTQATRGHLNMMSKRVDVATLLQSDATDADLKEKLALTQEARDFAIRELALPDNQSYRSYADLERPYVLWNVFATPEFSVSAKTWCYWFVGCLAYRGYFSNDKALAVGAELTAQGYDVLVGGVPAYSTLGRFADPLLNTMLNRQDIYVVELMFHELTHQVVYRSGDSEFSESLASFVQQEGVYRWLRSRQDEAGLSAYQLAQAREIEFVDLLIETRQTLETLYAQELPVEQMRAEKRRVFDSLQSAYAEMKQRWGGYAGYDNWFARDLNNAHLVAISTYHRLIPMFQNVLDQVDGDMPLFFARVEELAKLPEEQLSARIEDLLAP